MNILTIIKRLSQVQLITKSYRCKPTRNRFLMTGNRFLMIENRSPTTGNWFLMIENRFLMIENRLLSTENRFLTTKIHTQENRFPRTSNKQTNQRNKVTTTISIITIINIKSTCPKADSRSSKREDSVMSNQEGMFRVHNTVQLMNSNMCHNSYPRWIISSQDIKKKTRNFRKLLRPVWKIWRE